MEGKPLDTESKYQKLATEYSKMRSQVLVLKKALWDEQTKNADLRDIIKKHEQTVRKQTLEMESLTFRNEQLYKRTLALQLDLQTNDVRKSKTNTLKAALLKSSSKSNDNNYVVQNSSVLDEELHKKIMENAELISSISDREGEICTQKAKINTLEEKINQMELEIQKKSTVINEQTSQLLAFEQQELKNTKEAHSIEKSQGNNKSNEEDGNDSSWKELAERCQLECEVLRSKPTNSIELTDYYEEKIRQLLDSRQLCQSESNSLWAENTALKCRLEQLILANEQLQNYLERGNDELRTTIENYKSQLDAMTEHLAAQNDKITKQCDEIFDLKIKALRN